jgi:hypothetical protein
MALLISIPLDKSFDSIRDLQLIETRSGHFLRVLESGKVSINNYLRRFHNFAVDVGWLPWLVLPKRRWPVSRYQEKRAVTKEEHELILSRENNLEMRAFQTSRSLRREHWPDCRAENESAGRPGLTPVNHRSELRLGKPTRKTRQTCLAYFQVRLRPGVHECNARCGAGPGGPAQGKRKAVAHMFARKFLRPNSGWRIRAPSFRLSNSHRETIRIHFRICLFEAASYMVYGL